MKINNNIPGWNNEEILIKIAQYAAAVPENGFILELGALFGRSTYALGHNKKDSVKLFTIDIWPTLLLENHTIINFHDGNCGIDELAKVTSKFSGNPPKLDGYDFYELWKEFTEGIVNSEGFKGYTNVPNLEFPMIDFIFHDAGHDYENVYNDLYHWFRANGMIL